MNKPNWIKKSFVVFCFLASGVATQVVYNPHFSWRTIASDESGIMTFDEAVLTGESEVLTLMNGDEETTESEESVPETEEVIVIETETEETLPETSETSAIEAPVVEAEVTIEDNIVAVEEPRLSFEAAKEKINLLQLESDQLKLDFEAYFSKIEDRSKSSKELQSLVDNDLVALNKKLTDIRKEYFNLSSVVYDGSKLNQDMSDLSREELRTMVHQIMTELTAMSIEHSKSLYRPEDLVRDAKLSEHTKSLDAIQSTLCEQKQDVSSLVKRIEELISKKEEVVAEASDNADEEGEENVADSVEDSIQNQNDRLAMIQYPMQQYAPLSMGYPSPYTMFPNPYTMQGYGYGQGIGGFSPYFSMTPQVPQFMHTQLQPQYLTDYYGYGSRAPSSYGMPENSGLAQGFGTQTALFPQGIDPSKVQIGNDFMTNTNTMQPSEVMRIPSYSRSMINSTPFAF